MSNIIHFLPQFQQVNVIYAGFIERDDLEYVDYRKVVDFYSAHRDAGLFEAMMLDVLLEKEKQTGVVLLASLRSELEKNIRIYEANSKIFDGVDIHSVSNDAELTYDPEVEKLVKQLNVLGTELCTIIDIIDNKVDRPDDLSDQDVWDRYEETMDRHRAAVEILNELYQKREECRNEAAKYDINPFGGIYDLAKNFRSILEKYLPAEKKPDKKTNSTSNHYFDMGLVSAVHKLCIGEQFEDISELDLYAILNNQSYAPLKIKSGEKTRVCYLIHCLSEQLKGAEKLTCRTDMLKRLDISQSYYTSKYREPASEVPSRKSKSFVKNLNEYLNEYN